VEVPDGMYLSVEDDIETLVGRRAQEDILHPLSGKIMGPESEIGAADGGIFIDPLQGTSPYSYNWSTGDMTALIIGLTSDTYTVTVTDGNGCVDISSFDIVVCPDDLNIGTSTVNESFSGAADGSISVNPQGGTAPYEFEWNTGQNTAMIENLMAGSYSVTVTDVNGCNEVIEIELDIEVSTKELDLSNSLSLRPNPTNDRSTLVLAFPEAVDVEVRLHNSLGQLLYQTNRAGVQQTDIPLDLSTYSSGMYLVSIRVADQIHVERLILNR
ncbi:MAG: T9SS type A sorting domain-containing protein, partial [Bacteroidota bacterium]